MLLNIPHLIVGLRYYFNKIKQIKLKHKKSKNLYIKSSWKFTLFIFILLLNNFIDTRKIQFNYEYSLYIKKLNITCQTETSFKVF